MTEEKSSFWTTLPGILAQLAVLVGAIAGLWVVLHPKPTEVQTSISPGAHTDSSTTATGALPPRHDDNALPNSYPGIFIDDGDTSRVTYSEGGGWHNPADYQNLLNTQHYTYNPGSTASLEFRGDWIEVDYYRTPGGALMDVEIDSQYKDQIDCGTDSQNTEYHQKKIFTGLGEGAHKAIFKHSGSHVEGRPRSQAAGPNEPNGYAINFDGFRVGAN